MKIMQCWTQKAGLNYELEEQTDDSAHQQWGVSEQVC